MMMQWGVFIVCVSASIFLLGVGFVLSVRIIQLIRDTRAYHRAREWENRYNSLWRGFNMMRCEIAELAENPDNIESMTWADGVLKRLSDIDGGKDDE